MNKLLAILEAADEMNMMKKALPICKDRWGVLYLLSNIFLGKEERPWLYSGWRKRETTPSCQTII